MLKNLPIRVKMVALYIDVFLFTVVIIIVSASVAQSMYNRQEHSYNVLLKQAQYGLRMESALHAQQARYQEALAHISDKTALSSALQELEQSKSIFNENMQGYVALMEDDATSRELYDALLKAYDQGYLPILNNFISAVDSNNRANANTYATQLAQSVNSVDETIEKIVSRDNVLAVENMERSYSSYRFFCIAMSCIFVVYAVVTVALCRYLAKMIGYPAKYLADAAKRISQGEVDVPLEHYSRDELGILAQELRAVTASVREQADLLTVISGGDYTGSIEVRSDKDLVNKAISHMLDENNQLISKIRSASSQVSSGAQQIAQGAQLLASGSSHQASSVEQFSETIGSVMTKTQNTAQAANQALELTQKTGSKMGDGIQSMEQMLAAMQSIDDSSRNITRVIKVIEDIAFQTNILALNAAVEAARAGQHGKGFAVVADEVRNLAAKSAAAAKETTSLIEGSILRVQEGNAIVEQTNDILKSVEALSGESLDLMRRIAEESQDQARAIGELDGGLEQISGVIQSNSASAQQSAASAEEMSAQSVMMNEMVAKFRLRSESHTPSTTSASNFPSDSSSFAFSLLD